MECHQTTLLCLAVFVRLIEFAKIVEAVDAGAVPLPPEIFVLNPPPARKFLLNPPVGALYERPRAVIDRPYS